MSASSVTPFAAPAVQPRLAPKRIAIAALVAAGISLPLWFRGDFILFLATQAGVMMLVAVGLNFLTGYAGQVSLGHGALATPMDTSDSPRCPGTARPGSRRSRPW